MKRILYLFSVTVSHACGGNFGFVCVCAKTANSVRCEWVYVSHPATIKLHFEWKKKNTCTDNILIVSYILCKTIRYTFLRSPLKLISDHLFMFSSFEFTASLSLAAVSSAKLWLTLILYEKKELNSSMNETLITHMIVSALLILWHLCVFVVFFSLQTKVSY